MVRYAYYTAFAARVPGPDHGAALPQAAGCVIFYLRNLMDNTPLQAE